MVASKHRTETHSFEWKHCLVQILQSHQRYAKKWKLFLIKYPKYLSRSYIKRFVWYILYDSQSAFKFLWRLHYHTSCSYQVHKSCSYRLLSLQKVKQNDLRTSNKSRKNREKRKVYVQLWIKRRKNVVELYETLLQNCG